MMNPRVSAVSATRDHKLNLLFTSGERGVFDCSGLLGFGVFQELKDLAYFTSVRVIDGTVVWPHEQDICPDTLYLECKMSSTVQIIGKKRQPITAWEAWERPLSKDQWRPGRSAMEIAKAFFRHGQPRLPDPLLAVLVKHPAWADFHADEARPEFKTALPPNGRSGPRNHDVWVRGHAGERTACIGIEAKADEKFDGTLASKQRYAVKRTANGEATDMPERLDILGHGLFGSAFDLTAPAYSQLGYQLLSGAAGTVIQAAADEASLAAFVIYEFDSALTIPEMQKKNADDLEAFVRLLPGGFSGLVAGGLVGPIRFEQLCPSVELFIGKVVEKV